MAYPRILPSRAPSCRKPLRYGIGKIALVAFAVLLPRLAQAQLAPFSSFDRQDLSYGVYDGQDGHGSTYVGTIFKDSSLVGTNLVIADLSLADLTRANLTGADLHRADCLSTRFTLANLQSADLSSAFFLSCNFAGANLEYANLSYVSALNTNFVNADLSYTNLAYADLRTATLQNTVLTEANLNQALLPGFMPVLPVVSGAVVTVDKGNTITVALAAYLNSGGTLFVNGELSSPDISSGGAIHLGDNGNLVYTGPAYDGVEMHPGSSLSGTGTVTGDVYGSQTTITPESSRGAPGTLKIMGGLSLDRSTLTVDIASLTSYSVFDVRGISSAAGSHNLISIDLQNGYTPNYGDTFNVLLDGDLYGGEVARFAHSLTLPVNWEFIADHQNGDTGTLRYTGLSAVSVTAPEPGTISLIGWASLPLLSVLRRRKRTVCSEA